MAAHHHSANGHKKQWCPRQHRVSDSQKIVIPRCGVVKGVDCTSYSLVQEQIVQIVSTSLDIDSRKPQTENRQEPEPEAPSPIDKHHPHPTEAIQVGRRGHQRQQDAHRPLGKDSRKDEEGHASRALHPTGDSRLHVVQRAESEDDKEGHEHVHTHKHHRAGKERGGEQHGLCRAPIRL